MSTPDATETEQYNTWLLNRCVADNPHCNIEKLKSLYFKTIHNNPLAIEYTAHQIAIIDTHLEKNKNLQKSVRYYTLGYESVMHNSYQHLQSSIKLDAHILSYAKGIADAHYKGFLREQLRKLKAGETLDYPIKEAPAGIQDFVKKYMEELQPAFISTADYETATIAITAFFISGKTATKTLFVKNGNIKKLAYAMGQIWRSHTNDVITYQYLLFYKKLFSVFKSHNLERDNVYASLLYKYSCNQT